MAVKAVGSQLNQEDPSSMKILIKELMKMFLVEVDGEAVTYQTLSEGKFENLFRVKEIRQIEDLYQELHTPTKEESSNFLKTIKPVLTQK